MGDVLPLAAIIAICLFITKEVVELARRKLERRRKTKAIQELLRHEIAENYLVLNFLFSAIDSSSDLESAEEKDRLVEQQSGRLYYERIDPAGDIITGGPVPPVATSEYVRLLPSLAELDRNLYAIVRNGYEKVFELDHLRRSFVDYVSGDPKQRRMWYQPFCRYAKDLYQDIERALRDTHIAVAGYDVPSRKFQSFIPNKSDVT
jgi:hypothetical protein